MNSPRAALVAMLVAVELLIAGLAIWCFGGAHGTLLAATHSSGFVAKPIAPIDAGSAPHVVINDPSSRVVVTVANDGLVHVKDLTGARGAFLSFGSIPQLSAARTPDGVLIERPAYDGGTIGFMFSSTSEVDVEVPRGSRVEVVKSSGAEVSGVTGGTEVHSQDGHIALDGLQGSVSADSADGSLTASDVRGDALALHSADGHVALDNVAVQALDVRADDGSIDATRLDVAGAQPHALLHSNDGSVRARGSFAAGGTYEVSTNDGRVELALPPGADLTIDASTGDGSIDVDGAKYDGDDSVQHTIRLGNGSGTMRLDSRDGSIHVITNGAL